MISELELCMFCPGKVLLIPGAGENHQLYLCLTEVCKRWRRLAYDKGLWKDVNLTPYKVKYGYVHYLGGTLRTLRVKGVLHSIKKHESLTEALLLEIGKRCPNLSELRLIEMNLRGISYECLPQSLLSLELTHCEIPLHWFRVAAMSNGTHVPPCIRNLEVDNVPNFSDQHLQTLASRTALKVLILSGTYRVTDSGIEKAAESLSELVHLKLHGCNISDSSLRHIAQHLTQLRTLDLTNFCSMTDAGLSCLGGLRSLQSLCFEYCDQITVEKLLSVCTGLPSLTKLNLN
eukprot:g26769.t1